ncbi:MAG: hypothetical protein ABIS08_10830 [Pseudolysinimonas sp.]
MRLAPASVPTLAEWVARVEFTPLRTEVRAGWTCFNPTLVRRRDGRLVAGVRSSNYRLGHLGSYDIDDPRRIVRSESRLVALDDRLRPEAGVLVAEARDALTVESTIRGYEDLRLFESSGGLGALASVRDRDSTGLCRIVLLEIADDGTVTRERLVAGPDPLLHEKNWVPFDAQAATLRIAYSWDPLVLGLLDLTTGELTLDAPVASPWGAARGGAGGVAVGDELLFVVHESITMPDWTRRYVHRFVTLTSDGLPSRESTRLTFLSLGIEFATGMALDGDRLLVSFGREDEEAWIASVRLQEVMELMTPVPIAQNAARVPA